MQVTLALVLSFFFMSGVKAATKEDIVAFAKANATTYNITADQIQALENQLNTKNYSVDEINTIYNNAVEIKNTMVSEGVTDVTKLSKEAKSKVSSLANSAAEIAGVKLDYNPATGVLKAIDKETGKVVLVSKIKDTPSSNSVLKTPTGADYEVYVAFSGLAIATLATGIYKKLKANA